MSRAAKGAELEAAFAEWMMTSLGYTSTKRRVLINGKTAKRPYEVDVHGLLYSRFWRMLYVIGVLALFLAVATMLRPRDLADVHRAVENTVASILPAAAGSGLLLVGIAAFVVGVLGQRKTSRHAWAECKNRRTTVKRADVEKLQGAVRDVRENRRADWKPQRVLIVSGGGFDTDAIGIARSYGIECYERTDRGFQRVL
jgi:hypothetical protein